MRAFVFLVTFAVLLLASACGRPGSRSSSGDPGEEEQQLVSAKGAAAAQALMKSLGGQLKGALQTGGPVQAIQVCQSAALPLTAAASTAFEDVSIRRTTLRPRNPANAPDETDRRILKELMVQAGKSESPPQPVIEWGPQIARYYHPLMIQEVCLNCHGNLDTFPPDLLETLSTLYPEDKATGYSLGDLRGVIRVDVERN